jgi:hypothetical protein
VIRRNAVLLAFVVAFGAMTVLWKHESVRAAGGHRTLKVKLNYIGAGVVDEKHKIYVMVADTNPFLASTLIDSISAPKPPAVEPGVAHILARQSGNAKDSTVTFEDVRVSPVYVAGFFDKSGSFNMQASPDPAPGSPMGAYGKMPDKLEAISVEEGKTAEIVLTIDDASKTP